jgi:hypothetical protein
MIRLIYAIPMWLSFITLRTVLIALGWVLVPIAAFFRAYEMTDLNLTKPDDGPIYHFTWRIMWLWDNRDDGIANRNYFSHKSMFLQIIHWAAIRNPVNNLRLVKILSFKIDPTRVRFKGSDTVAVFRGGAPNWYFCWHGAYSCFYYLGESREFLIGWKIRPKDMYGVPIDSYRFNSTGFGLQWKRVK